MDRVNKLNRFGEWTKDRPIFLMGDFNCKPGSAPYKVLVNNQDSNNSDLFDDSIEGGLGIDWILHKGNTEVLYYEKVEYKVDNMYPSDHKPVFVKVALDNN